MNLVVVSNRVARGKPNEPMTGGLAAALLPVVEHSGAIWVGSSGRVRDGHQKEPFAEIEALVPEWRPEAQTGEVIRHGRIPWLERVKSPSLATQSCSR